MTNEILFVKHVVLLTGINSIKPKHQISRRGEFDQRKQLILIAIPHQNGIEFDLLEPCGDRSVNPWSSTCAGNPGR